MDYSNQMGGLQLSGSQQRRLRWAVAAGLLGVLGTAIFLPPFVAICAGLLAAAMAAVTVSDLDDFIIPDAISLPAIPVGLIMPLVFAGDDEASAIVLANIAAAISYALAFYLLSVAYRVIRQRDGLGLGDVKLVAVAGAWTGLAGANLVVLLACLGALAMVLAFSLSKGGWPREHRLPFGAFLAPAIWLVWVGQQAGLLP